MGNLEDWDIFKFVPTITGTAAFQGLIDLKGFKPGIPRLLADRIPGEPRPAYHALAMVARKLGGFNAAEKLTLGQGLYAYTFNVRGAEVTVLWYDDGRRYLPGETPPTRSVTISVPPQPYRLTLIPTDQNMSSTPARRLLPINGKLTISVGVTPVFLEPCLEQEQPEIP
ncbi:MAG: hypothetical protein QHJ82_10695 [Verrucomicrobiota bacterium]|nr:hypothetical protein [Verrucomicrobiota bacterium]